MVLHHSEADDDIRYRQLEYHRQPKMTFLSFVDPFALTREDFVRLGQATQPDDGRTRPHLAGHRRRPHLARWPAQGRDPRRRHHPGAALR
jgi:hypothetical protein